MLESIRGVDIPHLAFIESFHNKYDILPNAGISSFVYLLQTSVTSICKGLENITCTKEIYIAVFCLYLSTSNTTNPSYSI